MTTPPLPPYTPTVTPKANSSKHPAPNGNVNTSHTQSSPQHTDATTGNQQAVPPPDLGNIQSPSLDDLLGSSNLLLLKNAQNGPTQQTVALPIDKTSTPLRVTGIATDPQMKRQIEGVSNEDILSTLTSSVDVLNQSLADMRNDITTNQKAYELRLETLEATMHKKHDDLLALVNEKIAAITIIGQKSANEAQDSRNKVTDLEATVNRQQAQVLELTAKFTKGDTTAQNSAKAALIAANSVEAHNRRWALRILGLTAPEAQESSAEAKQIAKDFFTDKLQVIGLTTVDIDCAHRVGQVAKGKQTMLVFKDK